MNSAAVDASIGQLRALVRRGGEIRGVLAADPRSDAALAGARIWQHDCADAVSQLSGGSKAHWLSRAYSAALLVRGRDGGALVEADVEEIVARVIAVLEQAIESLSAAASAPSPPAEPPPRRFDFVHDALLRPVLEAAYVESSRALDEGDYTRSLLTTCSALEAILTDALAHAAGGALSPGHDEMSFNERIAAAESQGLIRGGCGRLTDAARGYRTGSAHDIVTARDARTARQVLHVIMQDLNPGR